MTANVPAKMQGAALPTIFKEAAFDMSELTGGVVSGFAVISYRGKVWRIRKSGAEEAYVDADDNPMPYIDVVLLRSSPNLSKIYYSKSYDSGSTEKPDCWSGDGVRPDSSVQFPQAKTCAACKMNEWGSRTSESGKKSRACSDHRRVAVSFVHEIGEKGTDAHKFLLRIPPASLNLLKDFAEKVLAPKGIPYFAVVTRIGFDKDAEFPKLTFKPVRFLNEEEAETVLALRNDAEVSRIVSEMSSAEFSSGDEGGGKQPPTAAAPVAAPVKKPKPLPVEEEAFEDDEELAPAPKPKKAAVVVEEEEDEEPAPAPAPKAKKVAKKVAKPAPVEDDEDADEPAAKPPKAASSFDDMLDSLLGT